MRAFADLFAVLDETTKTREKIAALEQYFSVAPAADAAWAVYFLSGRKPRQAVPTRKLRAWAAEAAGLPDWLFEESYHAVGDLAETVALLIPETGQSTEIPLSRWVEDVLLPMRDLEEDQQRTALKNAWAEMSRRQRFVWNKLITGQFRVGVSAVLVTRALGQVAGLPPSVIAHRLMGHWQPTAQFYRSLIAPETQSDDASRPFPFCLAHPLDDSPDSSLGPVTDWQAEWKWDGIRAQLIRRSGATYLWTRGEELVTDRYPEITSLANHLPDGTVIDGEILPWGPDGVMPFGQLQRRIGRKSLGKKLLAEIPVILLAYDLLEFQGQDLREQALEHRRERLTTLFRDTALQTDRLKLSETLIADDWTALARFRAESRSHNVEGLMLKRKGSPYRVGRVRGDWWKWKIDPFTIDAVMTAAQRGSGRRASLYTDYTFGLWDGDRLVTVAKAYSGLTDAEIRQVDAFVRENTLDRFGPVRTVKPELVFELGFEGIQQSTRHRSGVAVRFPRILRWRTDKRAEDADQLATLKAMLPPQA